MICQPLDWFHCWEKWKDVESGKLQSTSRIDPNNTFEVGNYVVQERVCFKCGAKKLRTLRTSV